MKFSVIIPLEFHRDQGAKCVAAWCRDQTFPRQDCEVICVMSPTYPVVGRQAIEALLQPQDRLICSNGSHDMTHCVEGAAVAKGENLFFTESHVWPEPDVLQASTTMIEQNPDWAGFSCKTLRVVSNRLAEAEADMYEEAIAYGMNVHPWRKILDQCFVTRRNEYFAAGGFDDRLGHFAEWALAASYHSCGFKIGYAPHIVLHHFYIGHLPETDKFAKDFVDGEILYLIENADRTLLVKAPDEWSVRGNWDRDRAQALLKDLWCHVIRRRPTSSGPDLALTLKQLVACLPIAVAGTGAARLVAAVKRLWCRALLEGALRGGSNRTLLHRYIHYQAAIVHERRLRQITRFGRTHNVLTPDEMLRFGELDSATAITGFHVIETYGGVKFRWSRPAAIVEMRAPAGRLRLRLRCLPDALYLPQERLSFFFNEQPISPKDIVLRKDEIVLLVDSSRGRMSRLAWICKPRVERGTSRRRLGLPVIDLRVERAPLCK